MLRPILDGADCGGVISEAGCPGVADPGADIVALAQRHGIEVVPLVGPSSIIMGLMASGFNGQNFAFLGYLPIESHRRTAAIRDMQQRIARNSRTQIFIRDTLPQQPPHTRACGPLPPTCSSAWPPTLPVRGSRLSPGLCRHGRAPTTTTTRYPPYSCSIKHNPPTATDKIWPNDPDIQPRLPRSV